MYKNQIEFIVRALIMDGDNILLCENKKGQHYFLPGGHVEFGENFKDALIREIREEVGVSGKVAEVIGVLENIYKTVDDIHHEMNVIFFAGLSDVDISSQENHIAFHWIKSADIANINLLPKKLPDIISKWIKDKEIFFESTF